MYIISHVFSNNKKQGQFTLFSFLYRFFVSIKCLPPSKKKTAGNATVQYRWDVQHPFRLTKCGNPSNNQRATRIV